jgi:peptidoglycan/xylan/chitin deacetylase (PgdA/CDA1 family)
MFVSPEILRYQVHYLQRQGYSFTTVAQAVAAPQQEKIACVTFDDGYVDNLGAIPVLSSLGVPASIYVVTADIGKKNVVWHEAGERTPADLLSWKQLQLLQQKGWEIGSHAHHHVHLGRYSSEQQRELIATSCELLERELGAKPKTFAYPYGDYSSHTPALLREQGFIAAVTTKRGINAAHPADAMELKRIPGKGFRLYHYVKSYMLLRKY